MKENVLKNTLMARAVDRKDPAGEGYRSITLEASRNIALESGLHQKLVEIAALENGIIPERYQRSMGTIGLSGQLRLLQSTVGVVGAGGLGGFVIELLARMGVGRLVVVDDDTFSDSNLNRQLLSTAETMGVPKVEAAAERVALVNGAVEVSCHHCRGEASNLPGILGSCNLAVDCLDNLPSRFDLERACGEIGIPLIHGAIAGFLGQLAVIRPGHPLLKAIYGDPAESGVTRGVEVQLGNPAATPAMLASWEAGEAVKLLAGLDGVLPADRMLIMDMQSAESYTVELGSGSV